MPSRKKKVKVKKRQTSEKQLIALAKAREAKERYQTLRNEGFSNENIVEATEAIEEMFNRFSSYTPQSNPAVAQLMEEIGGEFKTAEELSSLPKSEFYKYATSLRTFLASPLSDKDTIDKVRTRFLSEILGENLTRHEGERRTDYFVRRNKFIKEHEDTASKAFSLYRRLESTHAGLILRGKISPDAYGSDNLIVDLFDFIESEFDGDFDKAYSYWTGLLEQQYQESQQASAIFTGANKISRFNWKGGELYDTFTAPKYYQSSKRTKRR